MSEQSDTVETARADAVASLRAAGQAGDFDVEEFGDHLRLALAANILEAHAPTTLALPRASLVDDPPSWQRLLDDLLGAAGATYALAWDRDDLRCPVQLLDPTGAVDPTDYGVFVVSAHGRADAAQEAVDWPRLVAALADLRFLAAVHTKVSSLSVVGDPSLYPFWIAGRRALRRRRPHRPEVGVHYRFLQNLSPRREARLYRALTPRWEIRRDKVVGERRWRGRRRDPQPHRPEPF